jgi:hypothetical protein
MEVPDVEGDVVADTTMSSAEPKKAKVWIGMEC